MPPFPATPQVFLSLTLHERNLLSLDFLGHISRAATTLFLEHRKHPQGVPAEPKKVKEGAHKTDVLHDMPNTPPFYSSVTGMVFTPAPPSSALYS